jgi:hypothetical protein
MVLLLLENDEVALGKRVVENCNRIRVSKRNALAQGEIYDGELFALGGIFTYFDKRVICFMLPLLNLGNRYYFFIENPLS